MTSLRLVCNDRTDLLTRPPTQFPKPVRYGLLRYHRNHRIRPGHGREVYPRFDRTVKSIQ
eukprot:548895-Hanusia_phi.AAC.3